jgi:hypothetical protein
MRHDCVKRLGSPSVSPHAHRWRREGTALAMAGCLALGAPAVATAAACKDYTGGFAAVASCPPDPARICTHGTLTGGFPSSYDFVGVQDPATGALTGSSVLTTSNGARLFGSDTGQLTVREGSASAAFVTIVTIVGGTKQYVDASGTIVATGLLNLATGDAVGEYRATICKSEGDQG